jgi:hypothetical protein
MTTQSSHISSGARRRTLAVLAVFLGAAALSTPLFITATKASAAAGSGYNWPVKPFNRPHPVRANFGDPRTTFDGPPTPRSLMTSGGIFEFHFGIDIAVPDGTPVFAVRSGVVSLHNARAVSVESGKGFATQYWHIVPAVRPGQRVTAYKTLLGYVMNNYGHVHFTELDHGRPVNPLAPGHLSPYQDTSTPTVSSISFRESDTGPELLPEYVHGRVVLIASAYDKPALPVPGDWNDLPVAPALLTWKIERAKDGRVVRPSQVAFDARVKNPSGTRFWEYYARGSRQNMATFGKQRAWREPGTYLYKLTRQPFDTTRLATGIYRLVVTATDIRGNQSSSGQVFIVRHEQDV